MTEGKPPAESFTRSKSVPTNRRVGLRVDVTDTSGLDESLAALALGAQAPATSVAPDGSVARLWQQTAVPHPGANDLHDVSLSGTLEQALRGAGAPASYARVPPPLIPPPLRRQRAMAAHLTSTTAGGTASAVVADAPAPADSSTNLSVSGQAAASGGSDSSNSSHHSSASDSSDVVPPDGKRRRFGGPAAVAGAADFITDLNLDEPVAGSSVAAAGAGAGASPARNGYGAASSFAATLTAAAATAAAGDRMPRVVARRRLESSGTHAALVGSSSATGPGFTRRATPVPGSILPPGAPGVGMPAGTGLYSADAALPPSRKRPFDRVGVVIFRVSEKSEEGQASVHGEARSAASTAAAAPAATEAVATQSVALDRHAAAVHAARPGWAGRQEQQSGAVLPPAGKPR